MRRRISSLSLFVALGALAGVMLAPAQRLMPAMPSARLAKRFST